MAKSVNKVILLGNVGKDPEIRSTAGGAIVANFTLATSDRFQDAQGAWQDRTEWHALVAFKRTAEIIRDCSPAAKRVQAAVAAIAVRQVPRVRLPALTSGPRQQPAPRTTTPNPPKSPTTTSRFKGRGQRSVDVFVVQRSAGGQETCSGIGKGFSA